MRTTGIFAQVAVAHNPFVYSIVEIAIRLALRSSFMSEGWVSPVRQSAMRDLSCTELWLFNLRDKYTPKNGNCQE